eukprot:CAMPEP_0181506148 /NCGR_PEP_ID=MMETSP1110-20121109/58440_1 /TAXON_ID=174948 /ORGANISM="Symbiodinium sp., Strain CCMP421" /LENGTH=112 /DNA_ID=CAMNT_0023635187 /DNA_START=254 /DNA_END=593 /DNA_ORIENTATION=+
MPVVVVYGLPEKVRPDVGSHRWRPERCQRRRRRGWAFASVLTLCSSLTFVGTNSQQLVVHSDAVVAKAPSALGVATLLANAQELSVGVDSLLVLPQVVPEDAEREVSTALFP